MKKLIFASLALLLVFTVPVMADNSSEPAAFQALSNLTAPGQMAPDNMTDEQLAAVQGQQSASMNDDGPRPVTLIFVETIAGCYDCNKFSGIFATAFEVEAE